MVRSPVVLKLLCRRVNCNSAMKKCSLSSESISQKTGVYRSHVPDVLPPPLHYRRALKSLREVKMDEKIKNVATRKIKHTHQLILKLMTSLTAPLTEILKSFKFCRTNLHPFENVVVKLTLNMRQRAGLKSLPTALGDIKRLRAEVSRLCKHYAAETKQSRNSMEAERALMNAKADLQRIFKVESDTSIVDVKKTTNIGIIPNVQNLDHSYFDSDCLVELMEVLGELRRLPIVDMSSPSVVLVGSPNVGKSSLVRAISSGVPEVADYPFTTRNVAIGHISTDECSIQVIDTPGLLDRPADARNDMEELTFSSMAFIPSVVIFVIDATETAGEKSTLKMQLNIRKRMRQQFPVRPWIDVVTKSDLGYEKESMTLLPSDVVFVSSKLGDGMDELIKLVHLKVHELRRLLEKK